MRLKSLIFILVIFTMLISVTTGCSNESTEKWAFSFVVWNGYIYKLSDEYVEEITKEIGEVTKYSDTEGTYSGNFSNKYEKGTKYFSIKGIAIREQDGRYRKSISDGKYGEKK